MSDLTSVEAVVIFVLGGTAGFTLGAIATSAFACWMFDRGTEVPRPLHRSWRDPR